ncbi:unnamed protein product [Meloidogyne enterolobii]|uniref:Uncharacterized protein n=1 Tax=Meloidogyne enterolobii TaxID=390850 RepID=A0ACB1BBK1_MELEN
MQQSLGLFFKNTLLTGGGGVRGFLGQRGLTPFVDGRVRGSNVSTFSGGGPTNVLDSRVYHHGGTFSGHLRFGGMQLSFPLVSGRGVHTGGDLTVSTVAARGSSNVSKVYSHPNQFIKKAEKYQRDGDYVRSSKNCWKAYAMVVKLLYKNLKINIQSYDTFHELSLFAIDFIGSGPDAVILGSITSMMEE